MKKYLLATLITLGLAVSTSSFAAESEMIVYANSGLTVEDSCICRLPDGISGETFNDRIKDSSKISFKLPDGSLANASDLIKTGEILVYDNSEE